MCFYGHDDLAGKKNFPISARYGVLKHMGGGTLGRPYFNLSNRE